MKKKDKVYRKWYKSMQWSSDKVEAEITKALEMEYGDSAKLVEISSRKPRQESPEVKTYFTYSLVKDKRRSFHEVEYDVMMNELQINWKESVKIKPPVK
jgi:hypothetical protein